jgi:hypothetical protein
MVSVSLVKWCNNRFSTVDLRGINRWVDCRISSKSFCNTSNATSWHQSKYDMVLIVGLIVGSVQIVLEHVECDQLAPIKLAQLIHRYGIMQTSRKYLSSLPVLMDFLAWHWPDNSCKSIERSWFGNRSISVEDKSTGQLLSLCWECFFDIIFTLKFPPNSILLGRHIHLDVYRIQLRNSQSYVCAKHMLYTNI